MKLIQELSFFALPRRATNIELLNTELCIEFAILMHFKEYDCVVLIAY